ncbi:MAG: cytochrome c [Gemmataceae bacterium]|nr:cytochrome c [Gemmataceae bacterium]
MRTFSTATLGILALSLALAGCGDVNPPYSYLVRYVLRTDPLVLTDKLGDKLSPDGQRYDPDRPGRLPLLSMKELLDPAHPFHTSRDKVRSNKDWLAESLLRDPNKASAEDRALLDTYLTEIFGTPANPTVGLIPEDQREALKLDLVTLERGSMLYRVHCLHCHGVSGDGRGPTARWINPHPRDYRQGLFKFQSVDQTDAPRPPRRADLHRVIKYGIEATAMPSFALLGDSDIDLLVSYVMHLSIRGEVEYETFKNNFEQDPETGALTVNAERPLEKFLPLMTKIVVNKWSDSQDREIQIGAYPYKDGDQTALMASVARGQTLFLGIGVEGKAANCVNCHVDYGRQAKFRFDSWGTLVRPNNLTQGTYRGGRRTIDLYYRIHSGINGSGMAHFGKSLKNESVWDLINFVQALPYPAMRAKLGINIDEPDKLPKS